MENQVSTAKIEAEIEKLTAQIEAASAAQIEKSRNDAKRMTALRQEMETEGADIQAIAAEFQALDLDLYEAELKLKAFTATMQETLVKVTTRYVVASGDLVSPAGFHPDEMVFIQPKICIQTNDKNADFPKANVPLFLYDLQA